MTQKRRVVTEGADKEKRPLSTVPNVPNLISVDTAPVAPYCAARLALSSEEEAVLKIMRGHTLEARALRAELKAMDPALDSTSDPGTEEPRRLAITERLEQLRLLFREQKSALRLANEEKMRRLGYLP